MMKKTADDKKLREKIKAVIKDLNITQNEAADLIAEQIGREDNFQECFKSDLKRCTNIQKLENYLIALQHTEKYRNFHGMRSKYEGDKKILGDELQKSLHQLSQNIRKYIDEQEYREC